MDWNTKMDNFLKILSGWKTRTEYRVGKNKKTNKKKTIKKTCCGGIAERSLQTISDSK